MARRRSANFWQYFPKKNRTVARRSAPDVQRRPGGRRRMAKLPQESADHPANFNCELNLPDRRRMSAGCVLKGCSIGGWPSDFCRIRAPDHRTVIRRSILPYCDAALNVPSLKVLSESVRRLGNKRSQIDLLRSCQGVILNIFWN